eukprot:11029530-Lingulodinium_polyedra.AAC.1
MERASAQFASHCGSGTSIRLRHSASCVKHCAATRSKHRFATTPARKPQTRATHARTENRSAHGARERA